MNRKITLPDTSWRVMFAKEWPNRLYSESNKEKSNEHLETEAKETSMLKHQYLNG